MKKWEKKHTLLFMGNSSAFWKDNWYQNWPRFGAQLHCWVDKWRHSGKKKSQKADLSQYHLPTSVPTNDKKRISKNQSIWYRAGGEEFRWQKQKQVLWNPKSRKHASVECIITQNICRECLLWKCVGVPQNER